MSETTLPKDTVILKSSVRSVMMRDTAALLVMKEMMLPGLVACGGTREGGRGRGGEGVA